MTSTTNSINNTVGNSNSGVTNTLTVQNTSNTASSQAKTQISVAGGTAGDAYTQYTVTGATDYVEGIDNSDSDRWKLSVGTALGTNDTIIVDATGGKYKGYGTNTAPAAGFIGEALTVAGSNLGITQNTLTNLTSLTMTSGVWVVTGLINLFQNGGTSNLTGIGYLNAVISTANNTTTQFFPGSLCGMVGQNIGPQAGANKGTIQICTPPCPLYVAASSTTTLFLNVIIDSTTLYTNITCGGLMYAYRIA